MSQEITQAQASELDYVIAIDTSGSMGTQYKNGKTRFQAVQEFTESLARYAEQVDDDGITVIPFGAGKSNAINNVTAAKVAEVFQNNQPWGGTPLLGALKQIHELKKNGTLKKNVVAFVITDGIASDGSQEEIAKFISSITQSQQRDEELNFGFIQIGDDKEATKMLAFLDDNLQTQYGARHDIVDTKTMEEAENLKPGELIWHVQND